MVSCSDPFSSRKLGFDTLMSLLLCPIQSLIFLFLICNYSIHLIKNTFNAANFLFNNVLLFIRNHKIKNILNYIQWLYLLFDFWLCYIKVWKANILILTIIFFTRKKVKKIKINWDLNMFNKNKHICTYLNLPSQYLFLWSQYLSLQIDLTQISDSDRFYCKF